MFQIQSKKGKLFYKKKWKLLYNFVDIQSTI